MVLRLKARESRSPPGLARIRNQNTEARTHPASPKLTPSQPCWLLLSQFRLPAGWSSPVARQAHNLKVRGSNPLPATNATDSRPRSRPGVFVCAAEIDGSARSYLCVGAV